MPVQINSATTYYYDYSVNYNYNTRQITIVDTSSYKPSGASLVGLQHYTITSPTGMVLTGTINPASPTALVVPMSYLGASFVVGQYTIVGIFTDQDDTEYPLTKATNLCLPTQNKTCSGANGCVTVGWAVRCIDNIIIFQDQTVFKLTANSIVYSPSTITYGVTIVDPVGQILASAVNAPSIQITPIVNGAYNINISDVAIYAIGDGVTVTVYYVLNGCVKQAQCNINLCDVYCASQSVYDQWLAVKGTGSPVAKQLYESWVQLAFLEAQAQSAIVCGNDVSSLLVQIEKISGVQCSCGCGVSNVNQGVNVLLGQNIVIQSGLGINVDSETVGNTTTFTVTNTLPETYLVKANTPDANPDYLINKIESTNNSIDINYDLTEGKVDLGAKIVLYNAETQVDRTTIGNFNTMTVLADTAGANGDIIEVDTFFLSSALVADSPTVAIKINGVSYAALAFGAATQALKMTLRINRTAAGTSKNSLDYAYYGAPSFGIYPSATQFTIPAQALSIDFTSAITISTDFTIDSATNITMSNLGFVVKHFAY